MFDADLVPQAIKQARLLRRGERSGCHGYLLSWSIILFIHTVYMVRLSRFMRQVTPVFASLEVYF